MIATVLRWLSLIATAILIASFGMFVIDQTRDGSNQQIAALNADAAGTAKATSSDASQNINAADPSDAVKRVRAKRHSALREKIDEANDVLVKPFTGIVAGSKSIWVERGIPTLLALLLFGFGGRLLANYAGARRTGI